MTDQSKGVTFVPDDFEVPTVLSGEAGGMGFRLEPLGPGHNERDHAAWMGSSGFIHTLPGFRPGERTWPVPMTLEENLGESGEQRDHGHDAEVRSWVVESRADLDPPFRRWVLEWLAEAWPFADPFYQVD